MEQERNAGHSVLCGHVFAYEGGRMIENCNLKTGKG